jgi:phenylalanyl-tRNA synthetase alpha chain
VNLLNIDKKLEEMIKSLKQDLGKCQKSHDFLLVKSKFLGNNSEIAGYLSEIKNLNNDDKKIYGKKFQETAVQIDNMIREISENILNNEIIDPFLPAQYNTPGVLNLIPQAINEVKNILIQMQFEYCEGPEIETIFRNFTALNVPENHPCRDNHQSFFLNNEYLLRTHTSNCQTYVIESKDNNYKSFSIGRVYRRDLDATHTPMFHQIEGLVVNDKANLRQMFHTLKTFLANFFEIKNPEIRIRPSFFPFVEPGYEIDIKFNNKWLEILGCGIIHPNVFTALGKEPKLGFAFGCGLERIAMVKYNISDLRDIYDLNAFIVAKQGEKVC